MTNWHDQSDDDLLNKAQEGMKGQGALVESMRRLRKSIDGLRESSDRYSKWVVGLTIVLVGLTIVLAILTALLVYKEFRGH
jgi:hypothetical protein